ncbi:hypothetical protein OUZ56_000982 [Daphnia magna]|uniref:Uncharacterized protein n=1 Tax=Daphnia magna TaxID=35525 RepID=A0ABR0A1A7_9CRUS|nr:hypothetical protein OUZ56_000982 [Daphnia magna]
MEGLRHVLLRFLNLIIPGVLVERCTQLKTSHSNLNPTTKAGGPKRRRRGKKRKKVVNDHFDEPSLQEYDSNDEITNGTKSCSLNQPKPEIFEETQYEIQKKKNVKLKPENTANSSQKPNMSKNCSLNSWETNVPSTEENQPKVQMLTLEDERKAVLFANCLFFVLNECISPALERYFLKRNLLSATGNDFKQIIYEIYSSWESILCCWARVCEAVDDQEASYSIRQVHSQMIQVVCKRSLRLASQDYNEGNGLAMTEILFACMLKIVAPSIRQFLTSKHHDFLLCSLDIFDNLQEIIMFSRLDSNFFANGEFPGDIENTLNVSLEARNHICHQHLFEILRDWEKYLVSWLNLLDIIRDYEAKKKLNRVLEKLIECKNKWLSINPTRFL